MGMIFVNRNRQSLGQFTEQEVANGLKSGKFLPDDLAWQEPMAAWQSLSTFTTLPAATLSLEPVLDAAVTPPVSTIEPAWERAESALSMKALIETIKQIISTPAYVFRHMPTDGGYVKPMIFLVLISWVTTAVAMAYQLIPMLLNPSVLAAEEYKGMAPAVIFSILIGLVIFSPVLIVVFSFINAGLLHLALLAVGGAKGSFQTTWRVLAYSAGTASIGQLVPVCGGLIAAIAQLIFCVIGLKEAHKTDLWRPIVAFVIVFGFCCAVIVGCTLLIGVIGGSLAQSLSK